VVGGQRDDRRAVAARESRGTGCDAPQGVLFSHAPGCATEAFLRAA
jgi:hypothetical protein